MENKRLHLLASFPKRLTAIEQAERQIWREISEIRRRLSRMEEVAAMVEASKVSTPSPKEQTPQELIEAIRKINGLTLKQIGDRLGLSKSQMSRIARGQSEVKKLTRNALEQLAREGQSSCS